LIISQFAIGLCSHKYRAAPPAPSGKIYDHPVALLLYGSLNSLTGKDHTKGINGCLPKSWKKDVITKVKKPSDGTKSKASETLDKIGKVLKFICPYKDKVLKMLGRRRYSRNFLQKSTSTLKNKGIFDKLKQAKQALSKLKDIKSTVEQFQSMAKTILSSWKTFNDKAKCESDKIKALLKKTWANIKKILSGGAKKVLALLINKILCNWEDNKKWFKHFLIGVKSPNEGRKLHHIGTFVGGILAQLFGSKGSSSNSDKESRRAGKSSKKSKKGRND